MVSINIAFSEPNLSHLKIQKEYAMEQEGLWMWQWGKPSDGHQNTRDWKGASGLPAGTQGTEHVCGSVSLDTVLFHATQLEQELGAMV